MIKTRKIPYVGLVIVSPKTIQAVQEVYVDTLKKMRGVVKWLLKNFDCTIKDECGNDITTRVNLKSKTLGILYPKEIDD